MHIASQQFYLDLHVWSIENIDIDNLPKGKTVAEIINSPRSLEAFKKSGIFPNDLMPVDFSAIASKLKERDGDRNKH